MGGGGSKQPVVITKEVPVRVEVVKEVIKEVERIVEKIVNLEKDEFDKNQQYVEAILNGGHEKINAQRKETILPIGPSGCGKSTALNLFFGTNFKAQRSALDVTVQMNLHENQEQNIIDNIGFLPSLSNFGKVFLLCFHRGFFPDFMLYPANNDRVVDIFTLYDLIKAGFIKVAIFPFNALVYYTNYTTVLELTDDQNIAQQKAFEKAINKAIIPELETAINVYQMNAHVKVFDGVKQIQMDGSMKQVFLQQFFRNGKYHKVSYEEHKAALASQDATALLRGLMVEGIKDVVKSGRFGQDKRIEEINETEFLKG